MTAAHPGAAEKIRRMSPSEVAYAMSRGWTLPQLALVEWLCDMVDAYGEDAVRHWLREASRERRP